ncbi:MAG TPA: divalent metal cation transporter [Sphingomicrobium sp.]|nr:divalent metal cation transporter [Sphingomicrobium sp.]
MNPLELTLGIMTAVGGFVDISQLVFSGQAGSIFGYALISAFAISTVGIMVFGEMCGRVAAVAHQPVFSLIRHRLGLKLGLVTLIASMISTLITTAAEIGGLGMILNHLTGAPYLLMCVASTAALMASMWVLPFKWIERIYGLLGLFMIVFLVALVAIHPPWAKIAGSFVPQVPRGLSSKELLTYSYFVVAIFSAVMFPYEAYFYSSGGIEEQWGPKDLLTNRVTSIVGMGLGSLLSIAVLALAAQLFAPALVAPQMPGSVALQTAIPLGKAGLVAALLGMLFAVGGAAVETCMANAYSLAQFFGWEWGRHKKPWEAPRFTFAWIIAMLVALAIVMTGVEVMSLVGYSIVFSILVLPLSYLPLMLLANDRSYMGGYANKWLAKGLGWLFFVIVTVAAVAAIPLYVLTSGGQA